jgi:predicted RNase H-like HicB family nuclease
MSGAERYIKMVEWSDEDRAFVGQCPGVIGPCCHGTDEVEVYRELCEIVAEWVEIAERDGTPLPPAVAGTGAAEKIASVGAG